MSIMKDLERARLIDEIQSARRAKKNREPYTVNHPFNRDEWMEQECVTLPRNWLCFGCPYSVTYQGNEKCDVDRFIECQCETRVVAMSTTNLRTGLNYHEEA